MAATVIEGLALPDFVQYLLDHHSSPTTLIICSDRATFKHDLLEALTGPAPSSDDNNGSDNIHEARDQTNPPEISDEQAPASNHTATHPLLQQTLALLSASQTIKLSFCPTLSHLLAYLSFLSLQQPSASSNSFRTKSRTPILAILNPIRLHRTTTAFSAQGMNKTIAAAVETAYLLGRQLLITECGECIQRTTSRNGEHVEGRNESGVDEGNGLGSEESVPGVWDEEISILNVTTKSFGAGEKGWVGRTVTIKRIAERWCTFIKTRPPNPI